MCSQNRASAHRVCMCACLHVCDFDQYNINNTIEQVVLYIQHVINMYLKVLDSVV